MLDSLRKHIETSLEAIPYPEAPANLYEPIRYILSLGGKRIRPVLALIGCGLFDEQWQKATPAALAIELFHNFTLMHDDIMDKAPIRRGKPTVHHRWNESVAILSGDAMLVKAYEQLIQTPTAELVRLLSLFNTCALQVCEGQQYDMDFEQRATVSRQEYLKMIRLKTAVLLGFSLQAGALVGGAGLAEQQGLYELGVNMGLAFQLQDDLLDVYAEKDFGKRIGGDIVANKKTLLLIEALERADEHQQKQLFFWLNTENFDPNEKVKAVKEIYDAIGVRALVEEQMQLYHRKAEKALNTLRSHCRPDFVALLEQLMQKLLVRKV
ncbi:MAG: isoprenyl synthetase [Thermonema sp.]|uniref:polyprenyl synthetase family protein n=1 Tax=Thermonema sp. TaxID=2231181 RepID=UPI0021DBC589|nr:polyprenyl synthetase family protein [Thermonema sp.]GIV39366.1 MAG: isoprenyl synthetase [Thermonema sp.]